jgi:hypothetical protein
MKRFDTAPRPLPPRTRSAQPPRKRASRVGLTTVLVLLCLHGIAASALAQRGARRIELENLRMGFDSSLSMKGAANSFKIGTWTPVWIQLRAGNERFAGFLELVVADDDGTPSSFRLPIDVGANQSQRLTAYARPGAHDPGITIKLFEPERGTRVEIPQAAAVHDPPVPIMPNETVILTLGRPNGVESIAELPGYASPGTTRATGDEILTARIDVQGGMMPGRWYGYDAARAIVVETNDRPALAALDNLRGKPLVDWVERGGHLIVSVGANWQAVRDSVLGPILPGVPTGQERVSSLEAIGTFAGSNKPVTPPGAPAVQVTKVEQIEERGGSVLSVTSNLPLVVRGPYGFGRVTLIALDVDQKPFTDWADRALFWVRALDLKRPHVEQSAANVPMGGSGRIITDLVSDLSGQLRIALEQFPGVKLIPFGWVAFFIFLYILLIGPGDYFFLKKVLKRMELTWITFPTIVVTVSLVAYYAAFVLKGNDLLVNKVDVVDIDQPAGLVRGTTWFSLFSPQNRDYGVQAIPLPLDRDPPPLPSGGEPARPPAGMEVVTSWFSAPDDRFGGMASSSRRFNFVGSGYGYQPTGGVELISDLRIPIWSTKCLSSRWFGPGAPLVASELSLAGTDRLSGTVTNRQSIPLEDALLAFGKQVNLLGTLAPGSTTRVELSSDRSLSGYLKSKQQSYLAAHAWNRDAHISRMDLMTAVMFHDSETSVSSERVVGNHPLQGLDLTGQLALLRPMLVARVRRSGSALVLANAPSQPKVDQLTLVRIVLPLEKKNQGKAP